MTMSDAPGGAPSAAGRERVAANAVLTEFAGHRPRHRHDRAFGRKMVQHHGRAFEHRPRSDVDDLASASLDHRPARKLREAEYTR